MLPDQYDDGGFTGANMDRPALRLAPPEEGDQGLELGFPGGGPLAPSPFEVGELLAASGYDNYDAEPV